MTYFCLECNKHHADAYKKHWKYKSNVLKKSTQMIRDISESEPQAFINSHEIAGLEIRIEEIEYKLNTIIDILKSWKEYMDRKHPYSHYYQPMFGDL